MSRYEQYMVRRLREEEQERAGKEAYGGSMSSIVRHTTIRQVSNALKQSRRRQTMDLNTTYKETSLNTSGVTDTKTVSKILKKRSGTSTN